MPQLRVRMPQLRSPRATTKTWCNQIKKKKRKNKKQKQVTVLREFPGGPVVRTWCFHCQDPGLIPGQGTKIQQASWCGEKTKQNKVTVLNHQGPCPSNGRCAFPLQEERTEALKGWSDLPQSHTQGGDNVPQSVGHALLYGLKEHWIPLWES